MGTSKDWRQAELKGKFLDDAKTEESLENFRKMSVMKKLGMTLKIFFYHNKLGFEFSFSANSLKYLLMSAYFTIT